MTVSTGGVQVTETIAGNTSKLDLGDREIVFLDAIWKDLSGTMWAYDTKLKLFFGADFFGFGFAGYFVYLPSGLLDRDFVFFDARVGEIDEVVVAHVIDLRADAQRTVVPVQPELGAVRGLDF